MPHHHRCYLWRASGAGWQQSLARGSICTGGHGTVPYEQNTQQSPALGRRRVPHPVHAWKKTQASVGMVSIAACPHEGQVSTDSSRITPPGSGALLTALPTS